MHRPGRAVKLPTDYAGEFKAIVYDNDVDNETSTSPWSRGRSAPDDPVLVRVHSECLTGDVFGSLAATAATSSRPPCR